MTTIAMDTKFDRKSEIRNKTAKPLLWVGLVSIIMFFGGLTSAVMVENGNGGWVGFQLPKPFWISTIVILMSSLTYWMVMRSTRKDNLSAAKMWMLTTLLLGIGFMFFQFLGWQSLIAQKIFFTGPGHTSSASYFYVLTWAHFAHAIGGIISLIVVFVKFRMHIYNSKNLLGLQISATYWHFLGILWVYLFMFLNLINHNI